MDQIKKKVDEKKQSRPVYVFDVPASLANGITSIGIVQLTAREEMQAAKRAGSDTIRLVYEQVKQSLVEVNGEAVNMADGSADSAIEAMDPKVRNLVMAAFANLHSPPEDTVRGFLESQSVRVA
jgi:hypothetical protein